MKRASGKIISIFFALWGIFAPSGVFADISVAPGISLRSDETGYDETYLKNIIRQLDRYGRAAKLEKADLELIIVGNSKRNPGLKGNTLYLPGNSLHWHDDPAIRRLLYTVLAAHRFNFKVPSSSPGMAWWIINGIDGEIKAAETSGQYIFRNRNYPVLAELSGFCGTLPDFAAMSRLDYQHDPILREFIQEHARLLLWILAEKGKLGDICRRTAAGEAPDIFLELYSSEAQAITMLPEESEAFLWNNYHPMPVIHALARLDNLCTTIIPETDTAGKLTQNYIECDWRKFAAMMRFKREDTAKQQRRFAKRFRQFGNKLSSREEKLCDDLADAARQLGTAENSEGKFENALNKLKNELLRRQKLEDFLKQTLTIHTPLPDNFDTLFDAAKEQNISCPPEKMKFLNNTMNNYLK